MTIAYLNTQPDAKQYDGLDMVWEISLSFHRCMGSLDWFHAKHGLSFKAEDCGKGRILRRAFIAYEMLLPRLGAPIRHLASQSFIWRANPSSGEPIHHLASQSDHLASQSDHRIANPTLGRPSPWFVAHAEWRLDEWPTSPPGPANHLKRTSCLSEQLVNLINFDMKSIACSLTIVLLFLLACQKEKNLGDRRLLPPSLLAYRTTDQAVIKIFALSGDAVWRPFEYVAPDRFKIYRSIGDPNDFKQIDNIPNDETYTYTATGLEAGTPYFFYVKSEKDGLETVVSDTIMLVPSAEEQPIRLTNPQPFPFQSATMSPTGDRFAYTDPTYTWDNGMYGATSLFIYDLLTQTSSLVQRSAVFPDWSAAGVAFCSDFGEAAIEPGYIPQHLSLLDVASGNIAQLTSGAEFVLNPDISNDGEWIAFSSDEGHKGEFDIWKIRIDGSEKTELTHGLGNSVTAGSIGAGRPNWSPDGSLIYFGVSSDVPAKDGIFKLNLSNGNIEPVLQSQWQELNPVPSPDGHSLAFFSDRAGLMEIWLLDLANGQLQQLTGAENNAVESTWGKLEWLDDDTLLYVAYPNDGSSNQAYFKLDIP